MALCSYHFSEQWPDFQLPSLELLCLRTFSHREKARPSGVWGVLTLRALFSHIGQEALYEYPSTLGLRLR